MAAIRGGGGISDDDQARIYEDERRVFDMLTPNFTFFATETRLKVGPLGKSAVFQFIPRADGLTREQFTERYAEHAKRAGETVAAIPGLTRSVLNHPVNDPLPLFPFDGITESWFETQDDAARALADDAFGAVSDDLAEFSDLGRATLVLTSVCHRWSEP